MTEPAWVSSSEGDDSAGDAEVGHLDRARCRHQHVARLDVAVHDAALVGVAERSGDLEGHRGGALRVERSGLANHLGQRLALHVLHDDVVRAGLGAPVVHADDVGVRQVGRSLSLAAESLDEGRVGRELGEQHLHGDGPIERAVAGQEHICHAAASDTTVDLVAPAKDDRRRGAR
ncbi:MAG: hypothetical protein V9E99_08545 [Microthrixaceae bacterium]